MMLNMTETDYENWRDDLRCGGQEYTTITESNTEGIRIRCPKCNITFTRDFYEHRGELGRQRTIEAWNTRPE